MLLKRASSDARFHSGLRIPSGNIGWMGGRCEFIRTNVRANPHPQMQGKCKINNAFFTKCIFSSNLDAPVLVSMNIELFHFLPEIFAADIQSGGSVAVVP